MLLRYSHHQIFVFIGNYSTVISSSSSSSSWHVAFSRSLLLLQSSSRMVYLHQLQGSVAVTPVSRQIWWIQVVGGRPQARLSCDGRSPSLTLVQTLRIWLAGTVCQSLATWPNRLSRRFRTMNETSSMPVWRRTAISMKLIIISVFLLPDTWEHNFELVWYMMMALVIFCMVNRWYIPLLCDKTFSLFTLLVSIIMSAKSCCISSVLCL